MARRLILDTAMGACTVVLADDDTVVAAQTEPMTRGHQERLAPMARAVVADAGLSFADLDSIAVTVGPGSFTGLRVGIAFARGLGLALDRPVAGLSTLDALAASAVGEARVVAAVDARRGQLYAATYDDGVRSCDPEAGGAASIAEGLRTGAPPVLIGSGAEILAEALARANAVVRPLAAPEPDALARLAARAGHGPADPQYVRPPDATPPKSAR